MHRLSRFINDFKFMKADEDDEYDAQRVALERPFEALSAKEQAEIKQWTEEQEEMNVALTTVLGDAERSVANRTEFLVSEIYKDKMSGSPHDLAGLDCVYDFFIRNEGVLAALAPSPRLPIAFKHMYYAGVIPREMLQGAHPRTLSMLILSGVFDEHRNGYDDTDIKRYSNLLELLLPRAAQGALEWFQESDVFEGVIGATATVGKLMLQHVKMTQASVFKVVRLMPAFGRSKEVVRLALEKLAASAPDRDEEVCFVEEVVALTPEAYKDEAFWLLVAKAGPMRPRLYPASAVTDALIEAVAHTRAASNVFKLKEATQLDPHYVKLVAQNSSAFLAWARERPEWDAYYPIYFKQFPNMYRRLSPETRVRLPVATTLEALSRNPWMISYTPTGPYHGARHSVHAQEGTRLEYWFHSLGAKYNQHSDGYNERFHEGFPVPPNSLLEPLMARNCGERDKLLGVREFQLRFKGLLPELVHRIVEYAWRPDEEFWRRSSRLHQVAASIVTDKMDPATERLIPVFETLTALAPSCKDLQRIVGRDLCSPKDTTPLRRLLLRYQCRCTSKKHSPNCPLITPRVEAVRVFETPCAVRTGGPFDPAGDLPSAQAFNALLEAAVEPPKKRKREDKHEDGRPKKMSLGEYFAFHARVHSVDPEQYQGPTIRVSILRFPANLKIAFQQDNPKQTGSDAHARYEIYKHATTLAQFAALSDNRWSTLYYDYHAGFVVLG